MHFAALPRARDVDLRHPVFPGLQLLGRRERRYIARFLVVELDVGDRITIDREGLCGDRTIVVCGWKMSGWDPDVLPIVFHRSGFRQYR
jgi:hypothetical protein